jgi:hypothetical protein
VSGCLSNIMLDGRRTGDGLMMIEQSRRDKYTRKP